MPMPYNVVQQILQFGAVTSRDVLYDIGWGDGAVANAAARGGTRAGAYPLCPLGYVVATRNARNAGVVRTMTVGTDFYAADLRDATVVVLHTCFQP
jgi:predicted RNA methylase